MTFGSQLKFNFDKPIKLDCNIANIDIKLYLVIAIKYLTLELNPFCET